MLLWSSWSLLMTSLNIHVLLMDTNFIGTTNNPMFVRKQSYNTDLCRHNKDAFSMLIDDMRHKGLQGLIMVSKSMYLGSYNSMVRQYYKCFLLSNSYSRIEGMIGPIMFLFYNNGPTGIKLWHFRWFLEIWRFFWCVE